MTSPLILLIDDDESLTSLLADSLRREGYAPRMCSDVAQAEHELRNHVFDVILLDVMLPDRSGFEFCVQLRNQGVQTPVLMLTARGDVTDRVTGLRLGADDYLPKPFEVPELLARIEALRRRTSQNGRSDSGLFEFGAVCVNLYQRSVLRSGQPVELTRLEFNLLSHLIRNRGRIVFRDELLRAVWGYRALPYTRTVDVHMWKLRRKLEADPQDPRFLRTVHGTGYLFASDSSR
jgi:two-component system, OmpR family, alkaline phosphatase synthesis response regulator PhoP